VALWDWKRRVEEVKHAAEISNIWREERLQPGMPDMSVSGFPSSPGKTISNRIPS